MALDFPSSPSLNQVFTSGNRSWIWNGTEWIGNTPIINYTANSALLGNGTSLFQEVAPGTAGNLLTSNGTTWTSATAPAGGITNVVTATGNTTLTSTPTLLRITPTNYGTTVTLPNATTMTAGAGKFTIQNLSEYHVRIVNASNTLLGFVYPFDNVNIDLASASTSAGTWTLNNAVRVGISAVYVDSMGLVTSLAANDVRILELDSDRQFYVFGSSSNLLYGQVYNQTTNTFGSPTLIRNTANVFDKAGIALIDANSILVVSQSSTAAQAVVLSISGTTITVNTAATQTAAGSLSSFQFFRAIPNGGYIYGYYASSANFGLLPVSVSGTTPSFGTEVTAFTGLSSNTVYAHTAANKLILFAVGDGANGGGFRAFSLSGNTITSGSQVSTGVAISAGTRFVKLTDTTYFFGGSTATNAYVGVISLSGLTITQYISSALGTGGVSVRDSITMSSTKVFFTLSQVYYNILTYTGSGISLGTALTTAPAVAGTSCHAIRGTDVACSTGSVMIVVDCSGSSPSIKSSNAISGISSGFQSAYDESPSGLQTSNARINSFLAGTALQPIVSFSVYYTTQNLGAGAVGPFYVYTTNFRMPNNNYKMGFALELTSSSWALLRKFELV
jgi:hypothetical protein